MRGRRFGRSGASAGGTRRGRGGKKGGKNNTAQIGEADSNHLTQLISRVRVSLTAGK